MKTEELLDLARQAGFDHTGKLNMDALVLRPEVRAMCADGKCQRYGKSWSCPPACGTLKELSERIGRYRRGILVQTTESMKDDFDMDAIRVCEQRHKRNFETLVRQTKHFVPGCLPMSAGSCTLCRNCTYPARPCRFPDRVYPSMEACGLLITDVCEKSGVRYSYGPRTMTFTSCILID